MFGGSLADRMREQGVGKAELAAGGPCAGHPAQSCLNQLDAATGATGQQLQVTAALTADPAVADVLRRDWSLELITISQPTRAGAYCDTAPTLR